ncbi:hypothetical protein CC85DRAFT_283064 [Cutaneotrichosporon oleaginosum]|uniref:Uncharacterized protein n=1 Tax=Cutaneotrichosporon oleaginosum TaxID=879819 RepID=A0A0J0XVP3_9TREE|nr:uncharacterized protein CC85DRAFT_283064 [Cutaneotrichosporon oleaginosum]KLT45147.1 hypothetical protein CC85DRAFT_283064 [Cutaneotrichosporon oleaginosum]TXT09827.1 hypothetical protein COLE_03761 [Cutaneotrichosporon oleaginosum]
MLGHSADMWKIPCNVRCRVLPSSTVLFERVDGVPITALDNIAVQLVRDKDGHIFFRVHEADAGNFQDFIDTTESIAMWGPTPCLEIDQRIPDRLGRVLIDGGGQQHVLCGPDDMGFGHRAWPSASPFNSPHVPGMPVHFRHQVFTDVHLDSQFKPQGSWLRSQNPDETLHTSLIQYNVTVDGAAWDFDDTDITPLKYRRGVQHVVIRFSTPEHFDYDHKIPIAANNLRAILKRACGLYNRTCVVTLAGLKGRYGVVASSEIGDIEEYARRCLIEFWMQHQPDSLEAVVGLDDGMLNHVVERAYNPAEVVFYG